MQRLDVSQAILEFPPLSFARSRKTWREGKNPGRVGVLAERMGE
jgi:hypothetical protein